MKKTLQYLVLLMLFFLFWNAAPKTKEDPIKQKKETFENALFFFESEDWQDALFSFKKYDELKPNNAKIYFFIGYCYLNISGQEVKAIPFLEKALKKISEESSNEIEETKAPLETMFYLGNAYRINNQLDDAIKVYNKYINHPFVQANRNIGLIEREIEACERAKTIRDKPLNIEYTAIDSTINNSRANYKPVLTLDEKTMVYMNSMKFYNAIFMSRFENGHWSEPEDISPQLGSDGDAEPCCFSPNGEELYLVRKVKNQKDIFVSTWEGKRWTNMLPLNKNINSAKDEEHVSISSDGMILYYSSLRRGGEGGLDIYFSEKDKNGEWGPAENIGKNINSTYNENMPFITEDGQTLVFTSEGHLNMGGYDIFTSRKLGKNNWEKPMNMGYPINTTSNNNYFFPINNGSKGYISLLRPEGMGATDIFKIENKSIASDSTKMK